MAKVLLPMFCVVIFIGGTIGSSGTVTGLIAVQAIWVAAASHLGCVAGDKITDWWCKKPADRTTTV